MKGMNIYKRASMKNLQTFLRQMHGCYNAQNCCSLASKFTKIHLNIKVNDMTSKVQNKPTSSKKVWSRTA